MTHNGQQLSSYHSSKWFFAAFPEEKGVPYIADNLATVNASSFRLNAKFQKSIAAAESRWRSRGMDRDISWRLHVALFAADLGAASANRGDQFVELGTGPGYMAAGILDFLGQDFLETRELTFFLMDTFRPEWQEENQTSETRDQPKYYADGPDEVQAFFSAYSNTRIVIGRLPNTLHQIPESGKVAFLHVDLNSASAEEASLRQIREKLGPGSVVLFDDSTNPGCQDQLRVHRAFASEIGTFLLELPTGQALMVCPQLTSKI